MVSRNGERGSSLIVAILACALIGVAVMVLSQDLTDRQRVFRHKARIVALDHLSDGAFAETLAELANDQDFSGMALRSVGQGVIWSGVSSISDDRVSVVAEAEFDGRRCAIEATVEIGEEGLRVVEWSRHSEPAEGRSRLLRKKSSNRR